MLAVRKRKPLRKHRSGQTLNWIQYLSDVANGTHVPTATHTVFLVVLIIFHPHTYVRGTKGFYI